DNPQAQQDGGPPPGTAPAPGNPTGSSPGQSLGNPAGSVPGQDNNAPPRLANPLDGRTGSGLSDRAIAANVRRGILSDPAVAEFGRAARVSAFNGRVTLQGEVRTPQEKDQLGAAAGRIAGV